MEKALNRDYGFLLCVGAEMELAQMCPGGDIANLRQILTRGTEEAIGAQIEMICLLSRWHEKARTLEAGPAYEQAPLTREELEMLPVAVFQQLRSEAVAAMLRDQKRTVEAKASKKDEAPRSS